MKEVEEKVWIIGSVVARDALTTIRDKKTQQVGFRKSVVKMGRIGGYESMELLNTEEIEIETPLGKCMGVAVVDKEKIVIINVLRAASPFVEGLLKAFPHAKQGVISARRKEEKGMKNDSFDIEINYAKFPEITDEDVVIIADPMLATGSTLLEIMKYITEGKQKPKKIILLSIISTKIGIDKIRKAYPDTIIVTVSIDPVLNSDGYIVPGLGDAGDRAFGSI